MKRLWMIVAIVMILASLPMFLAIGPDDGSGILKGFLGLGGSAIIVALVGIYKNFDSDTRRYPIPAIVLGVLINVGITWLLGGATRLEYGAAIIQGVSVGLSASGLYSWGSTIAEGSSANKANRPVTPI